MQPAIQSAQPDVVLGSKAGTALTSGRLNMSPGKTCSASRLSQSASTPGPSASGEPGVLFFFFSLVSRTRHHSCAGHCSTKRSLCNFIQNATIPPGRNTQQKNTKPTATKQKTKQKTNNATPTTPKPKTKHLSGNRVAYFCATYN